MGFESSTMLQKKVVFVLFFDSEHVKNHFFWPPWFLHAIKRGSKPSADASDPPFGDGSLMFGGYTFGLLVLGGLVFDHS